MRKVQISSKPVMASALVALLVSALVPAVAAAATRPITFSVYIGGACVSGRATDGATITLSLKSAQGSLKESATVQASPTSGSFEHCSSDGDVIAIGDRIRAHDGTAGHLLVVPELTLVIDRVADRFKGRAPAGDYVRLVCGYVDGHAPCMANWKIKVNSQGKWGYSPAFEVQGWQGMYLSWKNGVGDQVGVDARGPFVGVTIGSALVRGATRPNAPATVLLRRAGSDAVVATATKTANSLGLFQAKFRNPNGKLVKVRVGDRITSNVSSDVNLIVPNVTATVDAASNMATGTCAAGTYIVTAEVIRDGEPDPAHTPGDSEGGYFELEFGYPPIEAGEPVTIGCMLNAGDWVNKVVVAQ